MTRNTITAGLVILAAALATGCEKKVQVTFVNTTTQDLQVEWAERGIAGMPIGTVGAGGTLKTVVKEDKDFLPTWYEWTAGSYSGKVQIHEDTDSKLNILIPEGRVLDKDTEYKGTTKVETDPIPVGQEMVVD